jgi:hypothetical protein
MKRTRIAPVRHQCRGSEVFHKPTGELGRIVQVSPSSDLVYVDFNSDDDLDDRVELCDAEDLTF